MLQRKQLTLAVARTLVGITYWNLRVYLALDPFGQRLDRRDANLPVRKLVGNELKQLAKEQITELTTRTLLRYRFQSCRLNAAPSTTRFRLD